MADKERRLLQRESVNAKAIIAALLLAIAGVGLTAFTTAQPGDVLRSILRNLGATLVGIGVVTVLWELVIRRAFLREVLTEVSVSEALVKAGIRAVGTDFLDLDWQSFYGSARQLRLAMYQGSHTLTNNLRYIEAALSNGTSLEVILPDNENAQLMDCLSQLDRDPDSRAITEKVRSTAERFSRLAVGDNIPRLLATPRVHPFAVYLSDKAAVLGLSTEPTFTRPVMVVCEKGGALYEFAARQYDALRSSARPMQIASRDGPTTQST